MSLELVTPAATVAVRPGRGRPAGQRALGLRARVWWLIREKRRVTLDVLLTTLADGQEKDAASNILKYLARLEQHGVIERSAQRQPGTVLTSPGHVIWNLTRDLGRMAPVWRQKERVLFDPNSGQSVEAA